MILKHLKHLCKRVKFSFNNFLCLCTDIYTFTEIKKCVQWTYISFRSIQAFIKSFHLKISLSAKKENRYKNKKTCEKWLCTS